MNYFELKRSESKLQEFRKLVRDYWGKRPEDERNFLSIRHGAEPPETKESLNLRLQIAQWLPEIRTISFEVGVPTDAKSFPPASVGGPVIDICILRSSINPFEGYSRIGETAVLEKINEAIGAANSLKERARSRLIYPWNWIIDIPALIIRLPFLILRRAGLPASIEQQTWSYLVKALFAAAIFAYLGYLGLKARAPEIMSYFFK